jgi:DNA-binding MarR family transcriptional regulator
VSGALTDVKIAYPGGVPRATQPDPLALLLLRSSRWFDRALLARLADAGFPPLTSTQSLVFAHLDRTGTRQTVLADRLGVTRQSAHELVGGLRRLGLVEVVADASSARARLVVLTAEGSRAARTARRVLAELEDDLAARIGVRAAAQLRRALERSWGDPPL